MSFAAIDRDIAYLRRRIDALKRKLHPYAWDHRYDNFFAFDLPPLKPKYPCPNLPAWV